MKSFGLAIFATAMLVACVPAAKDPPAPNAEILRAADNACANLRSADVNCPEGWGSAGGVSCAEILARRHALKPLPLACWTTATSTAAAKGCGSLRCIR